MDLRCLNVITLAYLGDSVYELFIRKNLVKKGISNVNSLQTEAKKYVTAKAQAVILQDLIDKEVLSEKEIDIVKRGRNYKRSSHPRNTDIVTYKKSTGFEALIGYLYLEDIERLKEIFSNIEV